MSPAAFYQTITVCIGFFFYGAMFVKMDILTPVQCFLFGSLFILLAYLRNRIDNREQRPHDKELFENIYNFYKSVREYVNWYDTDHATEFLRKQKQSLDELEKYIEINEKLFRRKTKKLVETFNARLNEILRTLWANAQHGNQTKRYEVWKNIKFNIMENEINPLYEQLKKNLTIK